MRLFEVIVKDADDSVFIAKTACKNKKQLMERYGGNGEFIRVTDITEDYFNENSVSYLMDSLEKTGWGEGEKCLLIGLLEEHLEKLGKI